MTGVDSADAATAASAKHLVKDYTSVLKTGSLKGARIGVARDYFGQDPEVDRITEEAIATLKKLGAVVIDPVPLPQYFLQSRQSLLTLVMGAEFKAQITDYLKTTKAGYPKSFDDLVALSNDPKTNYRSPEKAFGFKYQATHVLDVTDPVFLAARDQGLPLMRTTIAGVLTKYKLDALVYPTNSKPAQPINLPPGAPAASSSPSGMANLTGFPDLIVPAGMTKDGLPVTLSFFGPAWSEPKLLAYGYDFEQATHARVLPVTTPALPTDTITY
jgi:amidase